MTKRLFDFNHSPKLQLGPGPDAEYSSSSYHRAILAYNPDVYWRLNDKYASADIFPSQFENSKENGTGYGLPLYRTTNFNGLLELPSYLDDGETCYDNRESANYGIRYTPEWQDSNPGFMWSQVTGNDTDNGNYFVWQRWGKSPWAGTNRYPYYVIYTKSGSRLLVQIAGETEITGIKSAKGLYSSYGFLSGPDPVHILVDFRPPSTFYLYKNFVLTNTLVFANNFGQWGDIVTSGTYWSNTFVRMPESMGARQQYMFTKNLTERMTDGELSALKLGYDRNFSDYAP